MVVVSYDIVSVMLHTTISGPGYTSHTLDMGNFNAR